MRLKRQFFNVKDVVWDDSTRFDNGVLLELTRMNCMSSIKPLVKNVTNV
jgi:hypothetical protein